MRNDLVSVLFAMVFTAFAVLQVANAGSLGYTGSVFSVVDQNQYQSVTMSVTSGGVPPYTYVYNILNAASAIVYSYTTPPITSATNTLTFRQIQGWGSGQFTANVMITSVNGNSVNPSAFYSVNSMLTESATPTISGTVFDSGQNILVSEQQASGGSPPYMYAFVAAPTGTGPVGRSGWISSNTYTFTTGVGPGNYEVDVYVQDGASNPANATSPNSPVFTINLPLATPAAPSISSTSVTLGQPVTVSTPVSTTGTGPYTYNFIVAYWSNAVVVSSISSSSNSYTYTPAIAGTYIAQVSITDSSPSPQSVTSAYSSSFTSGSTITTNTPLSVSTPTVNVSVLDIGQPVIIAVPTVSTGIGPWTYNFIILNQANSVIVTSSGSQAGNSYVYYPSTPGIFESSVIVQDSTNAIVTSGYSSSFTANNKLNTPTGPYPSSNAIVQGGTIIVSTVETGGTAPYTYTFTLVNASSITAVQNSVVYNGNYTAFTISTNGTYRVIVSVKDSASNPQIVRSYYSNTITVGGTHTTSTTTTTIPPATTTYSTTVKASTGAPGSVIFTDSNTILQIFTSATTQETFNVIITNITSTPPAQLTGFKPLVVLNVNVTQYAGVTVNITTTLPCSTDFTKIAPYIYNSISSSWQPITTVLIDPSTCSVTSTIPVDPVYAIFESVPPPTTSTTTSIATTSSSTTTSIPASTGSSNNSNTIIEAIVAIVVIVGIIYYALKMRKKRTFPYK
ncbi:MAG: hypothetical protein ACHQX1_00760 [Candidatus Micrarchaeales archaeon]